jgi:uroporphyrinogen-III synthase
MAHSVLVTRPLTQAREFAAEIEKRGFIAHIQTLLQIDPIPFSYEDFQKPDAILVTSTQGVGKTPPPRDWQDLPVFTVGMTTAKIVTDAGFRRVYSGQSDIAEIIPLIQSHMKQKSRILYLRGDVIKHQISSILPEYTITEKITYVARHVEEMEREIIASFAEIRFLTLFSERSGHILKNLIQKHGLISHLPSIKLLCLSRAVLESIKDVSWQSCHVAESPTTQSMIETLERIKDE